MMAMIAPIKLGKAIWRIARLVAQTVFLPLEVIVTWFHFVIEFMDDGTRFGLALAYIVAVLSTAVILLVLLDACVLVASAVLGRAI